LLTLIWILTGARKIWEWDESISDTYMQEVIGERW